MLSSTSCGVAVVVEMVSSIPLWCGCGGGNGFIPPRYGVAVVVVMVSSPPPPLWCGCGGGSAFIHPLWCGCGAGNRHDASGS